MRTNEAYGIYPPTPVLPDERIRGVAKEGGTATRDPGPEIRHKRERAPGCRI